jgi:hypothetical protein
MMWKLISFHAPPVFENVHPLEGGILRRKYRRDRRPTMPLENPVPFYARYAWETVCKYSGFAAMYWRYRKILQRVQGDDRPYTDLAMNPAAPSDLDSLELFNATDGARAAGDRARRKQSSARARVS